MLMQKSTLNFLRSPPSTSIFSLHISEPAASSDTQSRKPCRLTLPTNQIRKRKREGKRQSITENDYARALGG